MNQTRENFISSRLSGVVKQFGKYCVVGAIGVVVNLVVYTLLMDGAHLHYLAAATISFCVAVTNNFVLNKYWTFDNPGGRGFTQASRFLIISLMSLVVNLLVLRLLVEDAGLKNMLAAQFIAISVVTVLNFTGNKMWSFRQSTT